MFKYGECLGSHVEAEIKCGKVVGSAAESAFKTQAPPLILKADLHFEKKNRFAA